MSGSVNKAIIVGNVGADPEIRRTQSGMAIASLRIATSETWRDKSSGERKEKTEWHSVSVMSEGLVKVVEQYVKKGSKLYIEGKIATRKWQDQSGNDKYSTELVLQGFDAKLIMLDGPSGNSEPKTEKRDSYGNQPANFSRDLDEDIPFAPEWR